MKSSPIQQASHFSLVSNPSDSFCNVPDFQSSLLHKRQFQEYGSPPNREIEKKVKVTLLEGPNVSQTSLNSQSFANMGANALVGSFYSQQHLVAALLSQQIQNLQLLQWNQYSQTLRDTQYQLQANQKLNLIKKEDVSEKSTNWDSSDEDHKQEKETFPLKTEAFMEPIKKSQHKSVIKKKEQVLLPHKTEKYEDGQEPALAEFTKNYPEWDLKTIFDFLKSGRPKNDFENDRQIRLSKKPKTRRKRVVS